MTEEERSSHEEKFFKKKNEEALKRLALKKKEKPRLSPITGDPMVQEVMFGVVIDRCLSSGGIWLDAGELEQLIEAEKQAAQCDASWLKRLFGSKSK